MIDSRTFQSTIYFWVARCYLSVRTTTSFERFSPDWKKIPRSGYFFYYYSIFSSCSNKGISPDWGMFLYFFIRNLHFQLGEKNFFKNKNVVLFFRFSPDVFQFSPYNFFALNIFSKIWLPIRGKSLVWIFTKMLPYKSTMFRNYLDRLSYGWLPK